MNLAGDNKRNGKLIIVIIINIIPSNKNIVKHLNEGSTFNFATKFIAKAFNLAVFSLNCVLTALIIPEPVNNFLPSESSELFAKLAVSSSLKFFPYTPSFVLLVVVVKEPSSCASIALSK